MQKPQPLLILPRKFHQRNEQPSNAALGVVSNLGSEINDIVSELNNMNNNISDLLQTPSSLSAQYASIVGNIRNLGRNLHQKSFSDIKPKMQMAATDYFYSKITMYECGV